MQLAGLSSATCQGTWRAPGARAGSCGKRNGAEPVFRRQSAACGSGHMLEISASAVSRNNGYGPHCREMCGQHIYEHGSRAFTRSHPCGLRVRIANAHRRRHLFRQIHARLHHIRQGRREPGFPEKPAVGRAQPEFRARGWPAGDFPPQAPSRPALAFPVDPKRLPAATSPGFLVYLARNGVEPPGMLCVRASVAHRNHAIILWIITIFIGFIIAIYKINTLTETL
jgi:hypothetical protein